MEKEVKELLQTLNGDKCLKKPKEAGIILDKITQCLKQEQTRFTIGLLIRLLCEEDEAIFSFIWKTSSAFETVPSAKAALKLLDFVVCEFEDCAEPYFSLIFKKCLFLQGKKFAAVREPSLKIVKNLIMKDSKNSLDLEYLVENLENCLNEDTKVPGTVCEQVYGILGYLFEKYPELMKGKEKRFFSSILDSLRHNMRFTKNPSSSKIKGAFDGIRGYLVNYPPPSTEIIEEIYGYIKSFSKFRKEKRAESRAALEIFQNHWVHFLKFVFNDRDIWKENLSHWVKQSSEDRQSAFRFLKAFYSVIAYSVKKDPAHGNIVKSYVQDFEEHLNSKESDSYGKRSALAGIKLFVLTDSLENEDLRKAHQLVMSFARRQESFRDSWPSPFLPLSIECVSAFALKCTDPETLAGLQRLCVTLINNYPKIELNFQANALTALEKSFYVLGLCEPGVLENQIQKVLYQGLIRTCSCMTVPDSELLKENDETPGNCVTYKSYLSMWEYLLNLTRSSNLPLNASFALKKGVAGKVFDGFIESFIKIISKLNLNVTVNWRMDTDAEAEVETPSDLNIFVNCVDLFQDLIPLADSYSLTKWFTNIFQTFVCFSHKNPLVAGFYKILTATLRVSETLQFFEEGCKKLSFLSNFVEQVLVKIDQYKGDLQVVCLQMLLAAPVPLIETFVEKTAPALELAVQLGRSHLALLKDLVDALERWDCRLPPETTSSVMEKILPHFDLFFQSQYFREKNLVDRRKSKKRLVFNDSELLMLQKKFLMFVGSLDARTAMNLIELPEAPEERKISDKRLFYQPSVGGSLLDLEEVLSRATELAMSCSDRSTRITACELLYAAVMIVLSNINQLDGGYSGLFRKIIKACLVLASDSDGVVYQIFEPLAFQIARYFSSKKALHFSETQDLIDILMDFVTRPYDPTARDLSALLLREFTDWSIKQLTEEELKTTPENVDRVLNYVYSLSMHPSWNKRSGAAAVFNKIYSVLREEDHILDANWFRLFYYFVESLRMCRGAEDVTEITSAIQHVKRPLVERAKEFNEASKTRLVPPEFEGGLLSHLVKWTLSRCCESSPRVRRVSMSLVEELAPLVSGCNSLTAFIEKHVPEKSLPMKRKPFDRSNPSEEYLVDWLNYQTTLFEHYLWLLEQKIFKADNVPLSEFNKACGNYAEGITWNGEKSYAVKSSKQESVVAFLNVLLALKERAFYFCIEIWSVIKLSVFKPSRLGFDANSVSEKLTPVLRDLLKYFYLSLTHYAWNHFYEGIEVLVITPVLSHFAKSREIDVESSEFLFALKIIQSSGLWEDFLKRARFSMDGNLIVKIVFRSLFAKKGKVAYAVFLEPSCKAYLEDLMTVGVRVGVALTSVIGFLENEEKVREEDSGKVIAKGEYFWVQFKHVIFEVLESQSDWLVEKMLNRGDAPGFKFLMQILDNDRGKISTEIIRRWEDFDKFRDVVPGDVLFDLAGRAARATGNPGCLSASPAAAYVYSTLENKQFQDVEVDEIHKIFNLIPFLANFREKADESSRLRTGLSKFLVQTNAVGQAASQSFSRRNAMALAMKGLLKALKLSASLVVLDFILSIGFWFNTFCTKEETELALSAFADVPPHHSASALQLACNACFDERNLRSSMSTLYQWFLLPLLSVSSTAAVYEFVVDNLDNLCDLITKEKSGNVRKIAKKMFAAEILQSFFTRIPKEELKKLPKEKETSIVTMVKNLCSLNTGSQISENHRKFNCQVFNMICAIISAKCTDEKFFRLFVFPENNSLLQETVDRNRAYGLGMDFDEIPKRKTFSKALRQSANVGFDSRRSIKYVHTNTLFTSSLREDVTKFDLFNAIVRPLDSIDPRVVEIELEADDLNKHECMASVVGVVTKMVVEGIGPSPKTSRFPCWLSFFSKALTDARENVRLFALKVFYNLNVYLPPYSQQLFPTMLKAVWRLVSERPISYLAIDMIEMMVGWGHPPDWEGASDQLTNLVKSVISKSDSFRKDIIKYNLEVIKTMVEVWKKHLKQPDLSSFVFERLIRDANANDGVAYLDVQVSGILLSNGIRPWIEGSEICFFEAVLKRVNDENGDKHVFAEVCGLALNAFPLDSAEEFADLVGDRIGLSGSWPSLLFAVHKHYPKITSKFVFRIFSSAWNSDDSFTVRKLEMLLSHVSDSEIPNDVTFNRHAHRFLVDMMDSADVSVQELSVRIADRLLEKFDDEKCRAVMSQALRLQKSGDDNVRKSVCEMATKYFRKHRDVDDVGKQCRIVLLRGLNDPARELEQSCLRFWNEYLEFSTPLTALVKLFREMYTPETEDIFLSNLAKVIISSSLGNADKPIFPHPIVHNSKFKKRTLNLSSRQSLLGYVPSRMLANYSLEHVATLKGGSLSFLRATSDSLKFAPTVVAEEIATPSEEETFKKPEIPKNPPRRRFYRSSEKTNNYFARWRMNKKKKESEEEEWTKTKEAQVDVCGEYRAGDFPDIEISHFQILKPLEALAKRDPQIARHFLVSFYSGLMESATVEEKTILVSESDDCFRRILDSSTAFDNGVFGFVFQIMLKFGEHFDVDCEKISNAAVSSNRLSLGALLIEEMLAVGGDLKAKTKRRKGNETFEEKNWLELAKLYRNLEEFDVLSGIFLDKLNVVGDARAAISCEAILDFSRASKHYQAALEADPVSRRSEFYTESYLACLAKLSSWSSLNECIRDTVDGNLNKLWKNYYLLAWFLKSEMLVSFGSERNEFKEIEEFSSNPTKLHLLETNFGEELAVFDWLSGKVHKANHGVDRLCTDFIKKWSHINKWSYNLRAARLTEFQTVAELGFAVKSLAERSRTGLNRISEDGKRRWEKSAPCPGDDLLVWDVRIKYRLKFLSQLKESNVTSSAVKSNLKLAKAALAQRNLNLTKEALSSIKHMLPEVGADLNAEYEHCMNLGKMVLAELKMGDPNAGVVMYLKVWCEIADQISSAMETESEPSRNHLFRCNFTLGQLVSRILPFVKKQDRLSPEVLQSISAWTKSPAGTVVRVLENKGLEYLETAREISESLGASARSAAYLELGRYLLKCSRSEKLGSYLLRAMRLGDPEARRLFGCLLNAPQPDDCLDGLVTESESVPSWMFLAWLNQILANLNSEMFSFLKTVVWRIAQDYPNAIRYPLRLIRLESARPEVQSFASQLSEMLRDDIYENFLISMNYLGPPDSILRSHLETALKEVEKKNPDYSRVDCILREMHRLMFSSDYDKFRGPVFNYWETFKNPIKSLLDAENKKEALKKKIKGVMESIETSKAPQKRTLRCLESYSPWLRNFHHLRDGDGLELPGQYDGTRRPVKEHLRTVSSFKSDVLLFDSKCRPMRISVLGNDAVEYRFLVKFGEDLRQDERIQQVFGHFNYTLKESKQPRRLSVSTYKVIPLTFTLGMIEWIDDNVSLYEMIENSLGNDADSISRAQSEHLQFLARGPLRTPGSVAAQLTAYASVGRDAAVTNFNARVQAFPPDLLKKAFWALSTSPEHFVHLRANFAVSHAVMCVTHWLVGIGDRHLQNTLVSTKTGRVLGIDFGCAFGFATQFLAPPELVPFRLTPQILNLTHPLHESGWIKQTMIRCLRLFREENFGLSSILEVFALEPVMDWLEQAKKNVRCKSEDAEAQYPKQRISTVHQKLEGVNPTTIFEEDLKAGHSGSKYLNKYLEVLAGVEQHNVRARYPREGLSEEDQVACLIDLATDPHVLAKTYIGWNPWL